VPGASSAWAISVPSSEQFRAAKSLRRCTACGDAPAGRSIAVSCPSRPLAVDTADRVRSGQGGSGVDELLAGRQRRLRTAASELGDGLDAIGRHLAGILDRVGGDLALRDEALHVIAATVDRHDDHVALARGLQGLQRAVGRRFVDRVDDVDVAVGRQAVLHRGLAAGNGAGRRLVAHHLVVAALAAGVMAGLGLLAVLCGAVRIDAHAFEEAVVALNVD
jgi:hypothetical protein